MIEASREALNTAIEVASPGINVGMIGHAVQNTIENLKIEQEFVILEHFEVAPFIAAMRFLNTF